MKKVNENHSFFYKTFKVPARVWFNNKYKPTIEGKENILENGPVIFCGNHIHVMDQMMSIFSTKRMIHYLAKKEYFDGKNAWFFKASGCISVDRKIHDENAKSEALNYLRNGFAIGLFPEGTRNQISSKEEKVKELYELFKDEMSYEQLLNTLKGNYVRLSSANLLGDLLALKKININDYKKYILNANESLKKLLQDKVITKEEYRQSFLLPIKFGAASMAQKTEATIIPYIVSGKYKKDGNLHCKFLKPIKVMKNSDVEKITNKLRDVMLDELVKVN